MKIWFRIGPDRGNEQDGPQPPERYSSAHSTVRFLDPLTVLALTGEGSICAGSRFSGAHQLRAVPLAPKPLLPRHPGLKSGTNLSEIRQFPDISNRFWRKNRSYRKQTTKPCLTGSRIARSDARTLHDFRAEVSEHPRTCPVQPTHISLVPPPRNTARGPRTTSSLEDVRRSGRVLSLPGRHPRMGYIERIQSDLTAAMKQKDELRLSVLRMMKSALKHKEIEKVRPLDDLESMQVLQTLVKQRHESVEQFTKGGRNDLAEKEAKEIKIIETYLPAAPSDEEVHRAVEAAIAEAGADSLKQMGAVIKAARARLEGKSVDGKALSDRVRDRLTEKSAGKP